MGLVVGWVRDAIKLGPDAVLHWNRYEKPWSGPYTHLKSDGTIGEEGYFRNGLLVWGVVWGSLGGHECAWCIAQLGDIRTQATLNPWEVPAWRARQMGVPG